jgi:hypothetical protein
MIDLGFWHYFLGLHVLQNNEGIFLSHSKYASDLLCFFHMEYCKLAPSPLRFGVNLFATCTSPEVNATLFRQLVVILLYLIHTALGKNPPSRGLMARHSDDSLKDIN